MLTTANFDPFLQAVLQSDVPVASLCLSSRDKTTLWVLIYRMLLDLTDEECAAVKHRYGLYSNEVHECSSEVLQGAMVKLRSEFHLMYLRELLDGFQKEIIDVP